MRPDLRPCARQREPTRKPPESPRALTAMRVLLLAAGAITLAGILEARRA